MSLAPYLLMVLGLLLILVEFIVPGAVMGILGLCFLLSSLVLFALESASILATLGFFILILAFVFLVIKGALYRIRKSRAGLYSSKDQEGFVASFFDARLIGGLGVVLSDLKPGGYIEIQGEAHQALSQSGYLEKGTKVKIVGGEGESLIVQKEGEG